jgi:hypothetical protein
MDRTIVIAGECVAHGCVRIAHRRAGKVAPAQTSAGAAGEII